MGHDILVEEGKRVCAKCKVDENSFTSNCYGKRLISDITYLIQKGRIDFFENKGWVQK